MASLIVSALAYPIIQKRFINDPAVFKIAKMRDLVQIQVSATTVGDSQTSPEIAKFTLSLLAAPAGPITGVKVEFDFVEEAGFYAILASPLGNNRWTPGDYIFGLTVRRGAAKTTGHTLVAFTWLESR